MYRESPASYCAYENQRFSPAFFLAEKTHNKDLEISPCRLHPNFCYAKTSLNPNVK